ncbi:MAG: M23 family metallopeptidase [Bacteroidota bacterium]
MKTKGIVGLIIFFVLFVGVVFAFDYSLYTPSTIDIEFNQIKADHESDTLPGINKNENSVNIIIHPKVLFSITAEYLGEEREISEANKNSLEVFGKTFGHLNIFDIFKHEILIRDSDNREYWLPIQESFIDAFHEEYFDGCQLTLYLIISIIYDQKPLVIINEFSVQEKDSSYLKDGPFLEPDEFRKSQTGYSRNVSFGSNVRAVKKGKVNRISVNPYNQTNFGKFVELEHNETYLDNKKEKNVTFYTVYAFLSEVLVEKGDFVAAGDIIGKTGKSGPLANQNYDSEFLFCIYSYEDEPIIRSWTKRKPMKKFGVYWYDPMGLFK